MRPGANLTHQSINLTLAHDFKTADTWDLSDSLADLFLQVNRRDSAVAKRCFPDNLCAMKSFPSETDLWRDVDVSQWLSDDSRHGFIRVCSWSNSSHSRLFPCSLKTTAQIICAQLGIAQNALHVQLNGGIIRRLEPTDIPLSIQNEYLATIGYTDCRRKQEEGLKEDFVHLVKFLSGKLQKQHIYQKKYF